MTIRQKKNLIRSAVPLLSGILLIAAFLLLMSTTYVSAGSEDGVYQSDRLGIGRTGGDFFFNQRFQVTDPDVAVEKMGPEFAVIGESIEYTIVYQNLGSSTVTGVVLTDTLPISTTLVSQTSGMTPIFTSPGTYVWNIGDLTAGSVISFTVEVMLDGAITSGTVLTNLVDVSSTSATDDLTNNTSSVVTEVYPLVTIHDIQYVADPATNDYSPLRYDVVWVEGIVTSKPKEIGYRTLVIEDPAGGPWSGLMLDHGGGYPGLSAPEGTKLRALGKVKEYYHLTELDVRYYTVEIVSYGNPVPIPAIIPTGDFSSAGTAEQWESVLIEFQNAYIVNPNLGYGEWSFDDGSGSTLADDAGSGLGNLSYNPIADHTYSFIRGIGNYSFSNYKLVPRYDPDIKILVTSPTISKSAPITVAPGDTIMYTINVRNDMDYTLMDVYVGDIVPTGTTLVSILDGGYNVVSNLIWSLGDMPTFSSRTVRFVVRAPDTPAVVTNEIYDVTASNFPGATFGNDVKTVVAPQLSIHDVQGASHKSPYNYDLVAVPGIVTVVRSRGFYLQEPIPDADDATSEGIYVYVGSSPDVEVGDEIIIGGYVGEYYAGGYGTGNLPLTQITNPLFEVLSSGNPLPTPVVIGIGGRTPPTTVIDNDTIGGNVETNSTFDPTEDGIDFYESLECMLVSINNALVVGPTNNYGEIPVVPDSGTGSSMLTARGGILAQSDDFNPERLLLDDSIIYSEPKVSVGEVFSGTIIGVMDYTFGNYKLFNTEALPITTGGVLPEVTSISRGVNDLTVATFNIENFSANSSSAKINGIAEQIVSNLNSPDIIGLEEVQDNNGTTNDGTVDASLTYQALIDAIVLAGGPTYEYRDIAPIDGADGGIPGGNIRVGFLFRTDRGVTFIDRSGADATTDVLVALGTSGVELSHSPGRIDPTNPAFDEGRKSLVGEFMFNGEKLIVVVNHLKSKGGDDGLFERYQPPVLYTEVQRTQQAQVVNDFVRSILALDPSANVIVLGDMNDFWFSSPLSLLKSGPIVDSLIDAYDFLPLNEIYSYIYDGNSQTLDFILFSNNLSSLKAVEMDVVHINSEFPAKVRPSDHDPVLVKFSIETLIRIYLPVIMKN